MEIVRLNKDEFIKFSKDYENSMFFQSPYWIDIKKTNGWNGFLLGYKDKDKILAASVILIKKVKIFKIAYAPRGFLIDYNNKELLAEFTNQLKVYLKKHNVTFIKINPYIKYKLHDINGDVIPNAENKNLFNYLKKLGYRHNGFYISMDEKEDIEPRWLSVLDIKDYDIDTLFKNMRSTTRNLIRNSEKNSLKIIECDEANIIEFKKLMEHTSKRRKFTDRPLSYYETIYNTLKEDNLVKILVVEINFKELLEKNKEEYNNLKNKIDKIKDNSKRLKELKELESQLPSFEKRVNDLESYQNTYGDKKIIAGGLYMLYGRQLVYLFGASYDEFMKYNSQYLLQWEMIKYAKENNYDTFNFYGIDGCFTKDSKNYGLFDFKRGFNAEVVELIGEFDLPINKLIYNIYKNGYKFYHKLKNIKNK